MEQAPQTIYHSSANATVYSVCIVRQPSDQQLALAISVQDGDKMLRAFFLTQPQDLDNIGDLMDATQVWSVQDGMIVASNGSQPMPTNSYLISDKSYKDFVFTCKFRITGDPKTGFINAGIQYRSLIKEGKIIGYQADIGSGYWGDIYDEHRRGSLVKGNAAELLKTFKGDTWGIYNIVCKGNRHQLYINNVLMVDYTEKDISIPSEGVFALQIHSGGTAKVEYKDISIQEL